ncbi:MAG: class I SAM-dependent methyltransferase, partial [Candidatus Thorarchaeota archaeon]
GARVLDVGTGGGASLYPAVRRVGPNGEVIGIEICEGCFKHTSGEIERCGITNVKMLYMNAQNMDFDDESFDCVISGFIGWDDYFDFEKGNHIKPDKMIGEIYRVLKKGGRVGISGWNFPGENLLMRELLFRHLHADSPYRKEVFSWSHVETAEGWRTILETAGFVDIQTLIEHYDCVYLSEEEWWNEVMDLDWKEVMDDLEQKGSVTVSALKEEVFEMLQNYKNSDGIHQTRDAIMAFGIKPVS